MKINRKTVLSTAAVLGVAALIAGGTIAYFTDTEKTTNSFSLGNVDIELYESQLHRVNAGKNPSTCEAPMLGVILYTCDQSLALEGTSENTTGIKNRHETAWSDGYFSDDQIIADAENYKSSTVTKASESATSNYYTSGYYTKASTGLVAGSQLRKNAYVKNVGTSDAYVRIKIYAPASFDASGVANWMYTNTAMQEGEVVMTVGETKTAEAFGLTTDDYIYGDANTQYVEYSFVYTDALEPGEMTFWSPIGAAYVNTTATQEAAQSDLLQDADGNYGIDLIVKADAIQANGFTTAAEAFAAYDA